ncbi:MAG TPA: sigma-70 factor domain-containing protein, partial [Candidatus Binatus sp.]|nr:sigma-70 factor domain-containing protein [Candidatus Binatus sp.]
MKQKYEGKDLQGLVDLGREQGYLTFEQVNDYLPQDVASPTDLRAALDSFEDLDIKVLEEVPSESTDEVEVDAKEEPEEEPAAAPAASDSLGESSDPVRLYLKEMGNFQLLSREQEVEIAKRIEAGENEVEEEVLGSPIMLDFVIRVGERVAAGEADLRDVFEDAAEAPDDPDEERGPEADERQLKKLALATKKLTELRTKLEAIEEQLEKKPGPRRKPKLDKNLARYKERVKKELRTMGLSRRLMDAVIAEMRDYLDQYRISQHTIANYEEATGRSRTHLLKEAAEAEDRRHVLKINDSRENLLDIAARIRQAQKTIRDVEKKAKDDGEDYARKL